MNMMHLFAARLALLEDFLRQLDGPDPLARAGAIVLLALSVGALFGLTYLFRRRTEAESTLPPEEPTIPDDAIRIGSCGRTLSTLCPGGKIEIAGRRFDARCDGPPVPPGQQVIVTGGDPFNLVVHLLEPGFVPAALRGFGEPVLSVTQRRAVMEQRARRDEHERLLAARQARSHAPRYGAGVGLVWGVALLVWQWTMTLNSPLEALLAITLAVAAGVITSVLIWFHDDAAVASFGMLAGTVLSGLFTIPALGLVAGVFTAIGIGAAFMLLALVLVLFGMF